MSEIDRVRDEEGTTEVEQPAVVDHSVFYRVKIFTGDATVTLDVVDPNAAQELVTQVVKAGLYHRPIENGMEVYPVVSARVTGPFEVPNTTTEQAEDPLSTGQDV